MQTGTKRVRAGMMSEKEEMGQLMVQTKTALMAIEECLPPLQNAEMKLRQLQRESRKLFVSTKKTSTNISKKDAR